MINSVDSAYGDTSADGQIPPADSERLFGPPQSAVSPDISFVVSTIGRPTALGAMVRSIAAELSDSIRAEPIVVDQSDDDGTRRLLAETELAVPCRYLRSGIGVSAGRNAGLRLARGHYVMFPDDDVWFGGGLVDAATRYLDEHTEVVGYSVRVTAADGTDSQLRWSHRPQFVHPRNYHRTTIGPAMVLRQDAIVSVGGFDESIGTGSPGWYGACEDSDLVLRLLESGFKV